MVYTLKKDSLTFKFLFAGIFLIFLGIPLFEYITALGFLIAVSSFIIIFFSSERVLIKSHLKTGFNLPLIFLLISGLISFFAAGDKIVAFNALLGLTITLLIIYIITVYLNYRPEESNKISGILLFTITVMILYGLLQYVKNILPDDLYLKKIILLIPSIKSDLRHPNPTIMPGQWTRLTAMFFYPTTFAGYLILSLPVYAGIVFSRSYKLFYKILFLFILGGGFFCLFHTYSRAGWLCITAVIFIMVFLMSGKKIRPFVIILLIIFLMAVFLFGIFNRELIKGYIYHPFSDNTRILVFNKSLKMLIDHPITGVGLGNFHSAYEEYLTPDEKNLPVEPAPWHAHNLFIQLAIEMGIPGLFSFLWLVISLLCRIFSFQKIKNKNKWLIYGIFSSITGFLFLGFFDFLLGDVKSGIYFFIILSFASGVFSLQEKNEINSEPEEEN